MITGCLGKKDCSVTKWIQKGKQALLSFPKSFPWVGTCLKANGLSMRSVLSLSLSLSLPLAFLPSRANANITDIINWEIVLIFSLSLSLAVTVTLSIARVEFTRVDCQCSTIGHNCHSTSERHSTYSTKLHKSFPLVYVWSVRGRERKREWIESSAATAVITEALIGVVKRLIHLYTGCPSNSGRSKEQRERKEISPESERERERERVNLYPSAVSGVIFMQRDHWKFRFETRWSSIYLCLCPFAQGIRPAHQLLNKQHWMTEWEKKDEIERESVRNGRHWTDACLLGDFYFTTI